MEGLRNFAIWLLVFGLVGVYSQHYEKPVVDDLEIQNYYSGNHEDLVKFENNIPQDADYHTLKRSRRGESNRKAPIPPPRPTPSDLAQAHRDRAQPVNANGNRDATAAARARANAANMRGRQ